MTRTRRFTETRKRQNRIMTRTSRFSRSRLYTETRKRLWLVDIQVASYQYALLCQISGLNMNKISFLKINSMLFITFIITFLLIIITIITSFIFFWFDNMNFSINNIRVLHEYCLVKNWITLCAKSNDSWHHVYSAILVKSYCWISNCT